MANEAFICRCEEVTYEDIIETANKYKCSAREIKLRTRAAMGYCGGRVCRSMIDTALYQATGEKPTNDVPLKIQPPVRPVPLHVLGGDQDFKSSN